MDATYLAVRVGESEVGRLVEALPALGALGANVTMPLKDAVVPFCDFLADEVRATGAANTLVVEEGAVVAHNTDGAGALAALEEAGARVAGARVLLLGAGGAARAIAFALANAKARVTVANRTPARAEAMVHRLDAQVVDWAPESLAHAASVSSIVINATSVGMDGVASPLAASVLRPGQTVLDCVYRAGGTPLARVAAEAGATAVRGESMLLHQGALAFTLWTGRAAPLGLMRAAMEAAIRSRERPAGLRGSAADLLRGAAE
jgi:shikimate dehydrogenase